MNLGKRSNWINKKLKNYSETDYTQTAVINFFRIINKSKGPAENIMYQHQHYVRICHPNTKRYCDHPLAHQVNKDVAFNWQLLYLNKKKMDWQEWSELRIFNVSVVWRFAEYINRCGTALCFN